jgi:dTDP-4-dehydrorhamnose 3,5-epimerase
MRQTRSRHRTAEQSNGAPDALPHGVVVRALEARADGRGRIAEFFRTEWDTGIVPVQWHMTVCKPGVMRGVHVHVRHDDYFVLIEGTAVLGAHDLRPGSPTAGRSALLELRAENPRTVLIPHGVAHGFLFVTRSTYVIGTSHYFDPADELGCHWLDPDLGLTWPVRRAQLSARDAALPPLREVAPQVLPWRAGESVVGADHDEARAWRG